MSLTAKATFDQALLAWRKRNPLRRWLLREPRVRTRQVRLNLGVTRAAVSQWATSKVIPNLGTLVQLQDVTGIALGIWGNWLRQKPAQEKQEEVCRHAS